MPKYAYKVRDITDRVLTGTAEGDSIDTIIDRLSEQELIPVNIEELNFDGTRKGQTFMDKVNEVLLKMQTRVPYKSVVFFTRQLATMVNAGVPLAQALDQIATAEKPVFRKILHTVADDIAMGSAFSDAIARHPGAFDDVYVSVVHAGEIAGALDTVLDELATYMENNQALQEKVKGALRYPVFIGLIVTGLMVAIMWFLVPMFQKLYASSDAALPGPTLILITVSDTIKNHFLKVAGAIVAITVAFAIALNNETFKRYVDEYILYFPVFGGIARKNIWARFCRTMALLMNSGTPILQSVEIVGSVVGNKLYAKALEGVYQNLRTGELLSTALDHSRQFPVLIKQLTATGELAGSIDALLRKAADFYERDIRITVDSLASIIEPFLIVTLGGIVGAVMIALYLPIFKVGQLMN
ncbi:MAG: type II secretion system F family protein [Chitinivibrionales bacterium]|nr:type II secretion system F family protein [Chitinivibrionales bacterium]